MTVRQRLFLLSFLKGEGKKRKGSVSKLEGERTISSLLHILNSKERGKREGERAQRGGERTRGIGGPTSYALFQLCSYLMELDATATDGKRKGKEEESSNSGRKKRKKKERRENGPNSIMPVNRPLLNITITMLYRAKKRGKKGKEEGRFRERKPGQLQHFLPNLRSDSTNEKRVREKKSHQEGGGKDAGRINSFDRIRRRFGQGKKRRS